MTIDEASKRIEKVRAMAGDNEAAHGEEDDLRADFIKSVMNDERLPVRLRAVASMVLSSSEIDFVRWCA